MKSPPLLWFVLSALHQGLDVCYDKAQGVEDDPCDYDPLEPTGGLIHRPLVAGHHADHQGDGGGRDRDDRGDAQDLAVDVLHEGTEFAPDVIGGEGVYGAERHASRRRDKGPVDFADAFAAFVLRFHFDSSYLILPDGLQCADDADGVHGKVKEKADNDFRKTGNQSDDRHDAFVCKHGLKPPFRVEIGKPPGCLNPAVLSY